MLQKLPIINQQNFHGCMDSGTALKEFFLFFFLAVWEHGTNSGKAERNLVPLNFSLSLLFSSYAVLSYAMLLFYLSQRLLSESVESKMMPFTFKEAWRELFQGSACDELNLIFFFFPLEEGHTEEFVSRGYLLNYFTGGYLS